MKGTVKIVTIGGGSSYTPELMEGFIKRYEELPIKEIWLVDIEDGKEKVEKSKEDVLIDMPIVVLVNKNSASSSEILAGALKDLNEATIVGTTTYGKGVIQEILTLADGSG